MFAFIVKTYRNFRLWGWKGVFHYIPQQIAKRRIRNKIMRFARSCGRSPQRGITIIGGFSDTASLSKVFRDLAYRLKETGIPFQAYDPTPKQKIPLEDYAEIITPDADFDLFKYDHIIDDIVGLLTLPLPRSIKHSSIVFWEFDSGLIDGYPHILQVQDVIAMSDFNAIYFRKELPGSIGVHKILYPFRFTTHKLEDSTIVRLHYGLKKDDFVVFFNFALGTARKNPEGTMKAFALAFKDEPSAQLVLKILNAEDFPDRIASLKELACKLGIDKQLHIIEEHLSQHALYDLVNICDVYMSLHHGEGFGIGIVEAMYLGKVIMVTNASAPTEYCNASNSILIPAHIETYSEINHKLPYKGVKTWYVPDIRIAASELRALFLDTRHREMLGRQAYQSTKKYFSIEQFRASVESFLDSCI